MTSAKRAVTQEDVARRAGVSTAVVSYVLNEGTRPVATETRERVLRAIHETGYEANYHATALAGGKTRTAGLVVPDITNTFFVELARALQGHLRPTGHVLLLGDSIENSEEEIKVVRALERRGVDALFIIGVSESLDQQIARTKGTKIVFLDRAPQADDIASVTINNVDAASRATLHLLEHGRQRVAAITGPLTLKTARERLEGYRSALIAANYGTTQRSVEAPFTREGGYNAAEKLLRMDPRPDALFISSEDQAAGAYAAVQSLGLSIPSDVAIFAFDGTKHAPYFWPALSTITQPVSEITGYAVELWAHNTKGRSEHVKCHYRFEPRGSCGCSFSREPFQEVPATQ